MGTRLERLTFGEVLLRQPLLHPLSLSLRLWYQLAIIQAHQDAMRPPCPKGSSKSMPTRASQCTPAISGGCLSEEEHILGNLSSSKARPQL